MNEQLKEMSREQLQQLWKVFALTTKIWYAIEFFSAISAIYVVFATGMALWLTLIVMLYGIWRLQFNAKMQAAIQAECERRDKAGISE